MAFPTIVSEAFPKPYKILVLDAEKTKEKDHIPNARETLGSILCHTTLTPNYQVTSAGGLAPAPGGSHPSA